MSHLSFNRFPTTHIKVSGKAVGGKTGVSVGIAVVAGFKARLVATVNAIAVAVVIGVACPASADLTEQQPVNFNISRQRADGALSEFGRQAGVTLIYQYNLVVQYETNPLRGQYAVADAIAILFEGTDLQAKFNEVGHLIVSQKVNEARVDMKKSKKGLLAGLISLFGLTTTQGSVAQTDSTAAPNQLEEILVTAAKREQSLQDVSMSVSAVTEQDLEVRGIDDLGEFFRTVPGIQYIDFGETGIRGRREVTIRGVAGIGSGGPLVGYYIDETPMPISDPTLFDVARIEVLRGPQGTLYGAGTAGGTIKVVTNRPDSEAFGAKIDASISSTTEGGENYDFKGMVNVPIAEGKAALRLVGFYENADGYIDALAAPAGSSPELLANSTAAAEDDFNDVNRSGVRATLQFTPTDRLTITPMVQIQRTELEGEAYFHPETGDLQIIRELESVSESNFDLYNLTVNYDFDNTNLVFSSSYFENESLNLEDLTNLSRFIVESIGLRAPNPGPFDIKAETEETTHELRLMSTNDSRFQWTAGIYYHESEQFVNSKSFTTDVGIPGLPPIFPELVFISVDFQGTWIEETAIFGEVYYDITDDLKLTLGARWFDYSLDTELDSSGLFGTGPGDRLKSSEDGIRPKIALSYQLNEDKMVYASASKGFRTGGAADPIPATEGCQASLRNAGIANGQAPTQYDSDTIWNYELGFKGSWADKRIVTNASLFYIDWTDIAQTVNLRFFQEPGLDVCAFNLTINAGEATSKGFELESQFLVTENFDLALNLAYIDATFGEGSIAGEKGEPLPRVPELTASLSAEYGFAIGDLDAFLRADYLYVDERFGTEQMLKSYDQTNLRLGVRFDEWSASLFVNNATDERPLLGDRSFGSLFRRFTTLRPRTVGLNFNRSF